MLRLYDFLQEKLFGFENDEHRIFNFSAELSIDDFYWTALAHFWLLVGRACRDAKMHHLTYPRVFKTT